MRVVLRNDLDQVGKNGDIVEVADGYARNYLVPKGLAMAATEGVMRQAESMRRSRQVRDMREKEGAEAVARQLAATRIQITARSGEGGRLFGSVTSTDIAEAIEAQTGIHLDRRKLHVEPLKTLGAHEIPIRLHSEVEVPVTIDVVSQ
jgi:large subunit ribosomal protein L9